MNAVYFTVAVQGGGVEGADESGAQQGDAIRLFHREQSKKNVV
jgi:hypothetical protein